MDFLISPCQANYGTNHFNCLVVFRLPEQYESLGMMNFPYIIVNNIINITIVYNIANLRSMMIYEMESHKIPWFLKPPASIAWDQSRGFTSSGMIGVERRQAGRIIGRCLPFFGAACPAEIHWNPMVELLSWTKCWPHHGILKPCLMDLQ